jgi:hypothetical protein
MTHGECAVIHYVHIAKLLFVFSDFPMLIHSKKFVSSKKSIFVGPQVLNQMILFLSDDTAPISRGLWLTVAVTISQLMMSFCLRHYFFKCYKFGLKIRTAGTLQLSSYFCISSDKGG